MPPPLITASWLLENRTRVRLLDTRFKLGDPGFGRNAYDAGHIPGAVFVNLETDLHGAALADRVGGRHPMPSPENVAAVFSQLGLKNCDHIVTYDESGALGFYAPHLWWLLRYLGHDNVSVLEGGMPAWLAAGGTLETEIPAPSASNFQVHPRAAMIVDADYVLNRAMGTALIDSRAPERFRGEVEPLDWKAGHIPGAVNKNWADGLAAGGWKCAAKQAERFADVRCASEIIVYCGSGVSAGANMLALEMAGIGDAKLYPGRWSDWISDEARPVKTGAS